jgi:hypothetical protein
VSFVIPDVQTVFDEMCMRYAHLCGVPSLVKFIETQHPDARKNFRVAPRFNNKADCWELRYYNIANNSDATVFKPVLLIHNSKPVSESTARSIALDLNNKLKLAGSVVICGSEDEMLNAMLGETTGVQQELPIQKKKREYDKHKRRTPRHATRREVCHAHLAIAS